MFFSRYVYHFSSIKFGPELSGILSFYGSKVLYIFFVSKYFNKKNKGAQVM